MKKTILLSSLACVLLTACGGDKEKTSENKAYSAEEIKNESAKANAFFDRVFDREVDRDPVKAALLGIKKDYDQWTDMSEEHSQKELEIVKANLDSLKNFNPDMLDEQTRISYRLFENDAKQKIDNYKWHLHDYPVNQMGGTQVDMPTFLINVHLVDNKSDAEAYISRLSKVNAMFDQLITNLKLREAKNIIPPKFVFPYVLNDCKSMISGQPFEKSGAVNPLLEDITKKVNALKDVDEAGKKDLIKRANEALLTSVKPAYEKLIAYWIELKKKATTDDGAWKLPDGDAFYDAALKQTTTTDLTADQIHEIGLKEVERIHNEMREIMKKVKFKSDNLQEFFGFMRTDKQFYYPNTAEGKEAYRVKAVKLIDDMKKELDKLFLTKPKADIVVMPVEAFREKSAGGAFYEDPAPDGSRPGRYYINLYNMADQAIYQMEALAYHEGIPGHHMQIAIAQELKGIPKFRMHGGNTAYVEGWGLYSEKLPKEIGFYQDPYSDFGRLAMELFRAARLVVDTGIHRKKWSREKALAYFKENTPNPEGDNKKEIERYIVWPSQATGYKIGMNKIIELRENAKSKLGDKFDLREFHDVVLTSGPVPLNILEEMVNSWVGKKLKG
ncbi:MAG: lipoprotein [Bacteroidetes bacterium]|nr:lipoprotein [Bacteroidota bacterium]